MAYSATIEEESKELRRLYKDLLKGTYQELSAEDKKGIRKAFDLSVEAHKEQRRRSGEPYIYHPIAVAKIVADEIGLGAISIMAALLHDVVEDTDYTIEDIEQLFGETVARIVNGLTKISHLKKDDASIQAENYRKMLLTLNDDVRVILIKIADRYHNMQTLDSMPPDKQARIASETLFIYAPLAHRLGLYTIKTELEDYGLKYTEPEVYYDIARHIKETKVQRDAYIETFSEIIRKSLEKEGFDLEIKGRTKSIFSIRKKMLKQGVDFDEVYDKFAIRIIFDPKSKDEKHDAWKIYSIVTEHLTPNPVRLRDWMTQPKSTGYEALHTTVMGPEGKWVEVQIRSKRMNEIAEKGYAAHYRYKHGHIKETGLENWLDPKSKDEKHDAWKIYSIVTEHLTPNPVRLRDWMTQPKSTGYEALHTTVMGPEGKWVEVQIRSKRMNEIAEKGYAAHYRYKHGHIKETGLENWLNKLKDALENTEANAVDFVENIKLNLYSKEIYTFTPNGDIKSLPKGATPIDFAYAIHTDVGSKCRGAKVNGKIVPLSKELKSGDQVDIITSNNQKPKLAWLDYAVTSRARSKIKNALKEEQKKLGEEGKEILRRKLRSLKVKYNEQTINDLVNFFKLKTSLDLFYRIGNGSISNIDLKNFANQKNNALYSFFKSKTKRKKTTHTSNEIDEVTQKFDLLVFGKDEETLPYINAKCCNPIPGDKVFGFITINEGIKLHKVDCPNAVSMRANYGYRTLKAKWIDSTQREFKVNIMVSGIDNVGIVNDVTLVISNAMSVNIQRINISSEEGYFEGHIRVSVKNIDQLKTLIANLKSIDGVMKVEREQDKK